MKYEVTIGIPVFRAANFIENTLKSALDQTFQSIEFLIVNDCGGDGSMEVIHDVISNHIRRPDIHILNNDVHLGVGFSRNRIVNEGSGRYVFFLDSDDLLEPETIQLLVDAQKKHSADIVYGSYEKVDQVNSQPSIVYQNPSLVLSHKGEMAIYAFRRYGFFPISVCNCLISMNFLRDSGVKFINSSYWEDMAFTYDLLPKVCKAVILPEVTYHYICRKGSLSHYQDRESFSKEEISENVRTLNYMKSKCVLYRGENYLPYMCYNLEITSFYIVFRVLKLSNKIVPPVNKDELFHILQFPLSISEVLQFKKKFFSNLILFIIAHLPQSVCIAIVKQIGKKKRLI